MAYCGDCGLHDVEEGHACPGPTLEGDERTALAGKSPAEKARVLARWLGFDPNESTFMGLVGGALALEREESRGSGGTEGQAGKARPDGANTERLTDEEIASLLALEAQASETPWRVEMGGAHGDAWVDGIHSGEGYSPVVKTDSGVYPPDQADADFLVAAVNAAPRLAEEVRTLRELVAHAARGDYRCTFCGADSSNPHEPTCRAALALGLERG
jgi:hypothetical protein